MTTERDNKPNVRTLKTLIKIVNQNQLEVLEFGSIKIVKSKHIIEVPATKEKAKNAIADSYNNPLFSSKEEEELWTYSS